MDGLRLVLLLLGIVVVIGVYLYSRRQGLKESERSISAPRTERAREPRLEPSPADDEAFDDELDDLPALRATDPDDDESVVAEPTHEGNDEADDAAVKVPVLNEKIIVLNIFPVQAGDEFVGSDLLEVFDRAGLEYGQYNVFHRLKETREGPTSVFSVASATEPGAFDITTMEDESYRGLTLFMVLPGPMRGVDAFADMLATARRIAEQIKGDVKDRSRSTLTRQTAHHLREEIITFEHRLQRRS